MTARTGSASDRSTVALLLRLCVGVAVALVCGSQLVFAQAPASDSAGAVAPLKRGQRRVSFPVARHALLTGDTVRADNIATLDTTIVWLWSAAPDTSRAVDGWIARRAIRAGEVLRSPAIMAPPVVSAGARVDAIWQDGPLRLVLSGIATNSAAIGAAVGVRIDPSRRLDGVAIAPNLVRLR